MQRANSLEKTLMLGKTEDRRRRGRQRMIVGWHHRINGHEFEQAPGDGEGQGSLACYTPQGCKESDTTDGLNNNLWAWESRAALHKVSLVVKCRCNFHQLLCRLIKQSVTLKPLRIIGHFLLQIPYKLLGRRVNGGSITQVHILANSGSMERPV